MFVARSTARVRLARLAFLVAGVAPAAGLVAWATHLRSDAYRLAIARRWQETLGVPLDLEAVDHPRPGVIRARDCLIPPAPGRPAIRVPLVEVESSADEDRIRIAAFECDAGATAVFADLARGWLLDEVRFGRTCIVEVADFTWSIAPGGSAGDSPRSSLRVECVARRGTRALRFVRQSGSVVDEARIVRGPPPDVTATDGTAGGPAPVITVAAECRRPLPLAVIAMAAGAGPEAAAACGPATVVGSLDVTGAEAGWRGTARGRIEALDLAAASAVVGGHATGAAQVDVSRLSWSGGRVTDAMLECTTGAGSVDGRFFDRIVLALAARPGPAARPLPPGGARRFDAAGCVVTVGPQGIEVLPGTREPAGLAMLGGEPLLAAPAGTIAVDRVAWMLSAPGTAYAPALGPGAWLMSVLPAPAPPTAGQGRQF